MTDETDNPEPGTESVETSNYDNPTEWDYFDPDEDTEEITTEEGTDDEAAETEANDEAEQVEDEAEEEANPDEVEPEKVTATDDAVVSLADGTTATVKDLIAGNMRQQDYTRKSQENAEFRKVTEAQADRIERINKALVDQLEAMMPPQPDPAIASTKPDEFIRQQAQYNAATQFLQGIVSLADEVGEVKQDMSSDDKQRMLREENTMLVNKFPEIGTKDGRTNFLQAANKAALDVGFSPDEIANVTDHRIYALARWAQKGMEAEKAASTAKAKVEKAKPAAPRKPAGTVSNKNAKAMDRLRRSGSMRDALAVDFD